jgi:hypothetical protein
MRIKTMVISVIVLALAGAAGWYLWGRAAPTPQTHPALAEALYPLYSSATWQGAQAEQVTVGTTTYTGASAASYPIDAGMDPGAVFTPFDTYYDAKLKAAGWQIANSLAAGGHTGGQTGYIKDGALILTRFHIDYQNTPPDAPSACPCTVTLSLFSSPR